MKMLKSLLAAALLFIAATPAMAAEIGKPAPEFEATDIAGKAFKLSDQKGKIVVLEWTNPLCPFVQKHYDTNNMQKTQKAAVDQGVVWVSINSSAVGKEGHETAEEAQKYATDKGAAATATILDESGAIGKLYDAQTTPHLFIIDKEGNLVYQGAIDDNSSPRHDTVEGAKNYVSAALADIAAGKPVETATTPPYGCSVKYAN